MSNRRHVTIAVTVTLLTTAAMAAPRAAAAADDGGKYRDLLDRQGAGGVVQSILSAFGNETAAAEIEQLGNTLAASSASAIAVLDALAAEHSVEAATVSAELLYKVAVRVGPRQLTDDPGWRQFTAKCTALLGHDDPFVRGIATWALISVRDANAGRHTGAPAPDWMATCLALKPETSLECDFVLQAFVLEVHRTTRDLVRSAEEMVQRAEKLAVYSRECGGEDQRQRVATALETLRRVHGGPQDPPASTDLARGTEVVAGSAPRRAGRRAGQS